MDSGTWLGKFVDDSREIFPDGAINSEQLRMILTLHDARFGRIVNTGHGIRKPILRLTKEITEVHLQVGAHDNFMGQRGVVMWLREDGKQIASAVALDQHGRDRQAKSYWIKPEDIDGFKPLDWEPITTQHQHGFWSLGNDGAVPATRQWIKEHYVAVKA